MLREREECTNLDLLVEELGRSSTRRSCTSLAAGAEEQEVGTAAADVVEEGDKESWKREVLVVVGVEDEELKEGEGSSPPKEEGGTSSRVAVVVGCEEGWRWKG